MRFLTIYYETEYNDAYFSEQMRKIARLFGVSRLKLIRIGKMERLVVTGPSTWPRIFLIHQHITPGLGNGVRLDGLSMRNCNVAVVRYQNSMKDTLYVLAHEIGHLMNLSHCDSRSCVMGVQFRDGKASYAWWRFSGRRAITRRLFCGRCASHLSH
jgi:hypothetical protein